MIVIFNLLSGTAFLRYLRLVWSRTVEPRMDVTLSRHPHFRNPVEVFANPPGNRDTDRILATVRKRLAEAMRRSEFAELCEVEA